MTGADAIAIIILLTILVAVGVYLLHWLYRHSSKDEAFVRTWNEHIGDADHIAGLMREYAALGIDYFIVNLPNAAEGGVFTRFAEEVFPLVDQGRAVRPGR